MTSQISQHALEILEWQAVLDLLKERCSTAPGSAAVEGIPPLPAPDSAAQMKKISHIRELKTRGESMDFTGVTDITQMSMRAEKGAVLSLEELSLVNRFIAASARIMKFLGSRRDEFPLLAGEYNRFEKVTELGELLSSSITDANDLNSTKYPEIKAIRDKIFHLKGECEKSLSKLMNTQSAAAALQEKIITTFNQRYVLLVKTGMREKIKGTIHSISSSGATTYIEPDSVRGLNNKIIMLELELQNEIHKILKFLSHAVGEKSHELKSNLDVVAYLDFLNAAAIFSRDINGCEPGITEKPLLSLYRARHPLLHLIKKGEVVENDIELGLGYNCLIISGANTGGKTVLLKTIGLLAVFAIYGLHISAGPDSSIGLFTRIFADIGDDQNMAQSLSTFSGQIMIINDILKNADSGSLILIDEIIVGTNPAQGAALARSVIEELADKGCRTVVTTHYSNLKELASSDKRYANGSVAFDLDTLKPTYRLTIGYPGVSYAVEIARSCGLPGKILSRAEELLSESERNTELLLEDLQRHRQEIEEDRKLIRDLKEELKREREGFTEKEKKLFRAMEDLKMEKGIEFLEEMKEHRRRISAKISLLQDAGLKKLGEAQKEIIDAQKEISEKLKKAGPGRQGDDMRELSGEDLPPGTKVYVAPLDITGEIAGIDSSGKTALINFGGSYRARFKISELSVRDTGGKNEGKPVKKKKDLYSEDEPGVIGPVIQTAYNTIDLRGKMVQEAIIFMEETFDRMMRQRIDTVVVIHGHGTGALKQAVRENLKYSIYAGNFRPGEQGEGHDGVTIVKLRS